MSIDLKTDAIQPTGRFASLDAVLALIVGVGAVLYPIGFIQVVARVGLGATNDFSTAWLVASLMPPVQVAGQGVEALAGMWTFLIFLPVFLVLLRRWPLNETWSFHHYASAYMAGWRLPILVALTAVLAIVTGLARHSWQVGADTVITMAMAQLVLALVLTHRASVFINLALFTTVIYVGASASVVLDASQHHNPGLPDVAVGSYQGRLVTHSDGYWYVLTTSGGLVAVPDDHATVVTIQP
jgi:hypothetical protein